MGDIVFNKLRLIGSGWNGKHVYKQVKRMSGGREKMMIS